MGNLALNNGLSGILSSQEALDVISQNVSNASDEDYSRQRANIKSNFPLNDGQRFFGAGVRVDDVIRNRSQIIEERLNGELENNSQLTQLRDTLQQIEAFLNEPSDEAIRGTFSGLDKSLQNLANSPANRGARQDVVGSAKTFAETLRNFNRQLQEIGDPQAGNINERIKSSVREVNSLAKELSSLNREISIAKGRGGSPNDLLDQRDTIVNKISEFMQTQTNRQEGEFRVTVGGYTLVQGNQFHELKFESKNEGDPPRIIYDNADRSVVRPDGGQIQGFFDLRDEVIPRFTDQLNDLAVQYADRFNDLHKAAFGLNGESRNNFFQEMPSGDSGIFRIEGMSGTGGNIFQQRAGYVNSPDTVLTGDRNTNEPDNFESDRAVFSQNSGGNPIGDPTGTLRINDSVIDYDMSDDTIKDVIGRINKANNQAEAYLSAENRLVIKGSIENDYELSRLQDTGLLLDKANVLQVGGSNRTATQSIGDRTLTLTDGANFGSDVRIDAIAENPDSGTNGLDLAEGTLDFVSSNSDDFQVNYDAREDTLEDIVERINTRADSEGTRVRSGINGNGRFELFSFDGSQSTGSAPSAGTVTLSVSDIDQFSEGQEIGVFNNNQGEITTIDSVDRTAGEITVDVVNSYSSNINVTEDFDASFRVDDEASQQIRSVPTDLSGSPPDIPPNDVQVEVKDATVFGLGDEIKISRNDGSSSETATVTRVDESNDTIQIDGLSSPGTFTAGAGDAGSAIQVNDHTNRNRQLLRSLGMSRKINEREPGTEFAIEGESRRPPLSQQVSSFRVREDVLQNPDLVAAAQGDDTDSDGIAETTKGPGDGSNANALSDLKSSNILNNATQTPDEQVNNLITDIGGETALAKREKSASDKLLKDIKNQRQDVSGVNIDEELTKMLQHQQIFQASARIVQTVDELTQSVLQII